jgi:Protein of unknown function (DUF4239)
MSAWLHALPLGWMTAVVFGITYFLSAALYVAVRALERTEWGRAARAVTPALLSPLGVTFGLLVVFTASQVWGDVDHARVATNEEANALRTAVLLTNALPDSSAIRIRSLIAYHIDQAQEVEWPAMAAGQATLTAIPPAMAQALETAINLQPSKPGQVVAQRELVNALIRSLDARRQRILVSHSEINGVKWFGIILQALVTLAAVALVHGDNRPAAAMGLWLFATGAAVCMLLILSHDEPFVGHVTVKPTPLLEVRPN